MLFWAALDGELDGADSKLLVEHLRECVACRQAVRAASITHRAMLEESAAVARADEVLEAGPAFTKRRAVAARRVTVKQAEALSPAWLVAAAIFAGLTVVLLAFGASSPAHAPAARNNDAPVLEQPAPSKIVKPEPVHRFQPSLLIGPSKTETEPSLATQVPAPTNLPEKTAEAPHKPRTPEEDLAQEAPKPPEQRPLEAKPEAKELGRIVSVEPGKAGAAPVLVRGLGTDATRKPLAAGAAVRLGDRLETGAGRVVFKYVSEATQFQAYENSVLTLQEADGGKRVFLDTGVVEADVAKQPRSFVLLTPHAEATVLGTRFTLAAGARESRLDVAEGAVQLKKRGTENAVRVNAGQFAVVAPERPLETQSSTLTKEFQTGLAPGPAYAGCRGTTLMEDDPGRNHSAQEKLIADGDDTDGTDALILLSWDVSEIPARGKVVSATLVFQALNAVEENAYQIQALKRPWDEAQANWTLAAPGKRWQAAGAQGGEDRDAAVLATVAPRTTGAYSVALNAAGVAVVQGWINNPAANFGVLIGDTVNPNGLWVASPRAKDPLQRPKIVITYQSR